MENLKEFDELIERYETIQLDEIEKTWEINGRNTANLLTGFGNSLTCKLCKTIRRMPTYHTECGNCIYEGETNCTKSSMRFTYLKIARAKTPLTLLQAFRDRAKAMRKFLKNKLENL